MKHLLYILCLFVLSCDSGADDPCEQIVGEWEFFEIQHIDFIEVCEGYDIDIENSQNLVIVENIIITLENDCIDNQVFFNNYCPDDLNDCDNPIIAPSFPFNVDGDIMTLTFENIEDRVSPDCSSILDISVVYQRVE